MKTLYYCKTLLFILLSISIVSCEKNQPPSCQFLEPSDGYKVTKGAVITISVSAEDSDGGVSDVRLYINETGLATLEFPYNYELNTEEYRSGSYSLKVVARDAEGLESSDEIQIIIDAQQSTVVTLGASEITFSSAHVGGSVSDDGGGDVTESGVYWDTVSHANLNGHKVAMGDGLGDFSGTLDQLPHGTHIYHMAYAINSAGESLGEEYFFITNTVPTVQTNPVLEFDHISAVIGGDVTSDGGEVITETGVYWSASPNAQETGTRFPIASIDGAFSTTLAGLSPSTAYYIQAFAVNAAGESIGAEQTFTTGGAATVNTLATTFSRYKSATLEGEVTDEGRLEVTESGFYFGSSSSPETTGTRVIASAGPGRFSTTLANLIPGDTYYYKAFAVNAFGESLGDELNFDLPDIELGTFTDQRDQVEYGSVKIGEQVWMSENLKATVFNDGSQIPLIVDDVEWESTSAAAYCWYDNDDQATERGALYNWYAVETQKLCPAGWHVPSDAEWRQFEYYLGMEATVANTDGYRGNNEGGMLKTTTLWDSPNTGASDELQYSAMPTGRRNIDGAFLFRNSTAYYWLSDLGAYHHPQRRLLSSDEGRISRSVALRNHGLSVRCVKDD